ncbi:hypothetical protein TNIN_193781 [Trichonephila inaurata madagascariensis]|uniref:Uncharacterized protein n=1 Tax=Trichonephila inaurata madagascariensis TaxID=2747483 RepID=A0A8X6YCX5_9ARAC|nr:hypothetical protein TNIN_193781 [Trichonephila inaurata madagascariensis]
MLSQAQKSNLHKMQQYYVKPVCRPMSRANLLCQRQDSNYIVEGSADVISTEYATETDGKSFPLSNRTTLKLIL